MSRYRPVFCAIWSDDKFPFISDDAQLVWFHVYTNEFTNAVGIYKCTIAGLAADKRWSVERYHKGFLEGLGEGFFEYDETFQVISFPSFFKWNKPSNPNVLSSWLSAFETVPNCKLKHAHLQRLNTFAKGWGEGFAKVAQRFTATFGEPYPKQEQEQEQEQERTKTNRDAKRLPERYIYPLGLAGDEK